MWWFLEDARLWRRVVISRFGMHEGGLWPHDGLPFRGEVWEAIVHGFDKFFADILWTVGNCRRISFGSAKRRLVGSIFPIL